jgi:hypothetical protein
MVIAKAPWRRGRPRRRVFGCLALLQLVVDEVGDDFAVGLGQEDAAFRLHLLAQGTEVLDDAVVDQRDAVDDVRVGVADGGRAVGRPAGVGDADDAGQRLAGEDGGEIVELALRRGGAQAGRRRGCTGPPSHSRDIRGA